jgi:GNAT superfamily N-acetyltransferase
MPPYEISCDPARLDIDVIHRFLSQSYWSPGIPRSVVERAIANSLCFGVYRNAEQVGFARVITDKATFAYLADVFILSEHQGQGLAQRLLREVVGHPALQGLRRMLLFTRDAHTLYAKFGFKPLANPERVMDLHYLDVYATPQTAAPGG